MSVVDIRKVRPVEITGIVKSDRRSIEFEARVDQRVLCVTVSTSAFDRLQLAFDMMDPEDRREAALLEIEQLAGTHLGRAADSIAIPSDEIVAIAELREGGGGTH